MNLRRDTLFRTTTFAAVLVCLGCADSPGTPPHIAPLKCPPAAVSAYNGFGFDLLKALTAKAPEANIALSPVSMTTVLSMVSPALHPHGQAALSKILRVEALSPADLAAAHSALASWRSYSKNAVLFQSASALWLRDESAAPPALADRCRSAFGAHVEVLPADRKAATDRINEWVCEATYGRIHGVPPVLEPDVPLIVTNAVHFEGTWAYPFDRSDTEDATFHLSRGRTKTVPMMRQERHLRYLSDPRFQAVALPYADPRFEFVLCLPAAASTLSAFVTGLDANSWDSLLAGLERCKVELGLPRFALEASADMEGPLADLGAGSLFRANAGGLWLATLHHTIRVRVHEEGTEADAATVGSLKASAPFWLLVDRPFFFAIRDTENGLVLFSGVVFDPA